MRNIFVVVDGVGYEQVAHFMPAGLARWAGRLGLCALDTLLAYSSGIYPSIWSGQYPDTHSVWTEFYRREHASAFPITAPTALLPGKYLPRKAAFVQLAAMRKLGVKTTDFYAVPTSVQKYFSRSNADYTSIPPVPMPGSPLISDVIEKAGQTWEYVYCSVLNDESERLIKDAASRVDMLMVCLPELDEEGHHLGPMTDAFGVVFAEFARKLDNLLADLEQRWPGSGVFLFSDHGMTPVNGAFDFWTYLEEHGFKLGSDYLAFLNSTIASIWFDDKSPDGQTKAEKIIDALNASGQGRVLSLEEHDEYHVNFPDNRYGERFFVVNEELEIIPNFISAAWKPHLGMHGYDPRCASTRSFFIGGDQVTCQPRDVVGLYDVLVEATGRCAPIPNSEFRIPNAETRSNRSYAIGRFSSLTIRRKLE